MGTYDKKRIVAGVMISAGITSIAYTLGGHDIAIIACSVMVILAGMVVVSSELIKYF